MAKVPDSEPDKRDPCSSGHGDAPGGAVLGRNVGLRGPVYPRHDGPVLNRTQSILSDRRTAHPRPGESHGQGLADLQGISIAPTTKAVEGAPPWVANLCGGTCIGLSQG